MNKKNVILAISLMVFCTASVLPMSDDKKSLMLEAIYAADRASELDRFVDDKYIELLEEQNATLQANKNNYRGCFNKIIHRCNGYFVSLSAIALGVTVLLNSAKLWIEAVANDNILDTPTTVFYLCTDIDKIAAIKNKSIDLKILSVLRGIVGLSLLGGADKTIKYIDSCRKKIACDDASDRLIEKNKAIVAQLKEIKDAL